MKLQLLTVISLVALASSGCARFSTTQIDEREGTKITTKASAYTFLQSKSALANWKAQQTPEEQGAEVGSLNQETEAAAQAIEALKAIEAILEKIK